MKPTLLNGFFKCGSTWNFALIRKDSAGVGVDISDLAARMMFRSESVNGTVLLTLETGKGLTASDTVVGRIDVEVTAEQSSSFPAGVLVFFDLELTGVSTVWQSPTYYFTPDQEITRG